MIHNVDPQLSQWDVGRVVSISNSEATHIHFANQGDSKAVIIEIENGSAKIPDYLLQTGKTVIAYAVKDGVTLESKSFSVRKRERPENYVYEEDDRNYIYKLITDAEAAVVNAKQATTNANTATESATIATTNANVATNSANLAAQNANTATENANQATKDVNEAVTKANNAVKNMMVVGEAQGESLSLDNAIDQTLVGLRVFGKTTQDGTPTPDAPVDLVSIGESGSITVNVNNTQSMTIATPNGLPGIPVTSGGNYTDADGQQWVCDEIDFARGVYVQRVGSKVLTGEETYMDYIASTGGVSTYLTHLDLTPFICSHFSMGQTAKWANAGAILFYVAAAGCTTMDEFVAFVAEQYTNGTPITVAYILATPIETPLSEEELAAYANLHTYKDNTTVSNDAGAWMDIEYVMDAKKYIDSLVTGGIAPATLE